MRFVAVLFLLIVAWATAFGQAPPQNLVVTPILAKAVAGLTFNSATHRQEGNFSVSVNMGTPPSGAAYFYTWSSQDSALVFDDPSAASTTAHASGTGIYYVTCSVSLLSFGTSGESPGITITNLGSGSGSSECAAIGGPIGVTVAGNDEPTYSHDKNDQTKSWYMTYYGTGSEKTHDATMTIPTQPTINRQGKVRGTTIAWTLPGSTATTSRTTTLVDPQTGISVQPLSVLAKATGAFQDGAPKVSFHFDDGVISGDADDDSDSTQYQSTDPVTHVTTWKPLVYKVSSHAPKSLVQYGAVVTVSLPQPPGATDWTGKARYRYILQDTLGDPMPGVYIQERFTDGNPLHLSINGYGPTMTSPTTDTRVWITQRVSALDSGSVAATDGIFSNNSTDDFWYTWILGDTTTYRTTHTYYAGTKDATYNATTGIPVGTYIIKFVAGHPGTSGQSVPDPNNP